MGYILCLSLCQVWSCNLNKNLCDTTYYPHFSDEEDVLQRSNDLPKVKHFQTIRNNYWENTIFTHISSNAVTKLSFQICQQQAAGGGSILNMLLSLYSQSPSPASLMLWLFVCSLRELLGRMCSQKMKLWIGISNRDRTCKVILSRWFSNCLLEPVAQEYVPETAVVGLAPFRMLSN